MITCYPVWTAAARPAVRNIVHHIGRRIARHGFRHTALATVRIVCVSVPVWLAAPAPAAAPSIPAPETTVLPPAMLPWPGDDAPWGWGAGDMVPAYGPGAEIVPAHPATPGLSWDDRAPRVAPTLIIGEQPVGADTPTFPTSDLPTPNQPVPEPSGVAVMLVGIAALLGLRARQ